MARAEWWVMRVVQSAAEPMTEALRAEVASGTLAVVNGDVCEPIDYYHDQQSAMDRMMRLARPDRTYKVVMSADV